MNPQRGVLDEISVSPTSLDINVDDLIPGRNGVDFPEDVLYPNITVLFSRVGNLFFVQIPSESQSNVQQIFVEFFNPNGQLISSYTSPANSPALPNNLEVDDVLTIVVHLTKTSDDKSPKTGDRRWETEVWRRKFVHIHLYNFFSECYHHIH